MPHRKTSGRATSRMWGGPPRASRVGPIRRQTFPVPHQQLQSMPETGKGLLAALKAKGVQDCPSRWMGFAMIVELVLQAQGSVGGGQSKGTTRRRERTRRGRNPIDPLANW